MNHKKAEPVLAYIEEMGKDDSTESQFIPYQELQIYGVQVVAFLQLLPVAFLYLHPSIVSIFHVLHATLPGVKKISQIIIFLSAGKCKEIHNP